MCVIENYLGYCRMPNHIPAFTPILVHLSQYRPMYELSHTVRY